MATHSSTLAWRISWTRSPAGYSPWGHKETDRVSDLSLSDTTVIPIFQLRKLWFKRMISSRGWDRVDWVIGIGIYTLLLLLLSHFSRIRLCVTPIDSSPPGSLVSGILQAKTLEWVAISISNIYPTIYKIGN